MRYWSYFCLADATTTVTGETGEVPSADITRVAGLGNEWRALFKT